MTADDISPLDRDDGRNWARRIVCQYQGRDYPSYAGYCIACEALGIDPTPAPEKPYRDRQQAAAADVEEEDLSWV